MAHLVRFTLVILALCLSSACRPGDHAASETPASDRGPALDTDLRLLGRWEPIVPSGVRFRDLPQLASLAFYGDGHTFRAADRDGASIEGTYAFVERDAIRIDIPGDARGPAIYRASFRQRNREDVQLSLRGDRGDLWLRLIARFYDPRLLGVWRVTDVEPDEAFHGASPPREVRIAPEGDLFAQEPLWIFLTVAADGDTARGEFWITGRDEIELTLARQTARYRLSVPDDDTLILIGQEATLTLERIERRYQCLPEAPATCPEGDA